MSNGEINYYHLLYNDPAGFRAALPAYDPDLAWSLWATAMSGTATKRPTRLRLLLECGWPPTDAADWRFLRRSGPDLPGYIRAATVGGIQVPWDARSISRAGDPDLVVAWLENQAGPEALALARALDIFRQPPVSWPGVLRMICYMTKPAATNPPSSQP